MGKGNNDVEKFRDDVAFARCRKGAPEEKPLFRFEMFQAIQAMVKSSASSWASACHDIDDNGLESRTTSLSRPGILLTPSKAANKIDLNPRMASARSSSNAAASISTTATGLAAQEA